MFQIVDYRKIIQYRRLLHTQMFDVLQQRMDEQIAIEKNWAIDLDNKKANLYMLSTILTSELVQMGYNDEQVKRFNNSLWTELASKNNLADLYQVEGNFIHRIKTFTKKHPIYTSNPLVQDVIRIIEKNIRTTITNNEIAALVGKTPNYLNSVFKKHMKTTIRQFINRRKIEMCKVLISEGESIYSVAMDYGFYDQSHFNVVFKKITNVTPKEYKAYYYN
jgi:AraC-like DNA-binding protein